MYTVACSQTKVLNTEPVGESNDVISDVTYHARARADGNVGIVVVRGRPIVVAVIIPDRARSHLLRAVGLKVVDEATCRRRRKKGKHVSVCVCERVCVCVHNLLASCGKDF